MAMTFTMTHFAYRWETGQRFSTTSILDSAPSVAASCGSQCSMLTVVVLSMRRSVPTVEAQTALGALDEMIDIAGSVVVIDSGRKPIQILTKIDLVEWLVPRSGQVH